MCLELNLNIHPDHAVPILLSEDMKVYKIFRDNGDAPYQKFKYIANTKYELNNELQVNERNYISLNIHVFCVEEGFHAYLEYNDAEFVKIQCNKDTTSEYNYIVVECTLPKGSKVFYGKNHDIVSDQIIAGNLETLILE